MGAFHPVIFFTLVYGISLFLAIFVCRTVYYSLNHETGTTEAPANTNSVEINTANTTVAVLK
jgi:hypothetical protein